MPSREYRVRFAKQGETDLSQSTNVDFELSTTGGSTAGFLTALRRWGGQEVEPTKGRAKSRGIRFNVGESSTGEEFTQHVSDSQGRAVLQRRFLNVSARPTTDTSWTSTHVQASGKLTSLSMNDRIGEWEVVAQDERLVERETEAFIAADSTDPTDVSNIDSLHGTTTVQVWPMGLTSEWDGYGEAPGEAIWEVAGKSTAGGLATLEMVRTDGVLTLQTWMPSRLRQLIKDDAVVGIDRFTGSTEQSVSDAGTTEPWFETLVLKSTATRFGVRGGAIITDDGTVGVQGGSSDPNVDIPNLVITDASTLSVGDQFAAHLEMPNHAPTPSLPKHLGGASGQHAVKIAETLLGDAGVNLDSTQFTALKNDESIPNVSFRITESERLDRWLEENIWQPFMLVPTVNRRGELSPRRMRMPDGETVPNTSTLQTLGSSNVSEIPTWEHLPTELVTEINYQWAAIDDLIARQSGILTSREVPESMSADLLPVDEKEITKKHDRQPEIGTKSREIQLSGLHDPGTAERIADFHSEETFLRLGDGAIRTETRGLEELESVDVGEFVTVDMDIYPNIGQQARGGQRVLQVTQREFTVKGPNVEFMDVGQDATPLSAPSVTLSLTTDQGAQGKRHSVDLNVSTTSAVLFQIAASTNTSSTSPPNFADNATVWGSFSSTTPQPQSYGGQPSGQRVWARAKAVQSGRIGSTWQVSNSTVMDALSAPTNLGSSNVGACSFDVSLTYAESDYPCEVLLDSTVVRTLAKGTSGDAVTATIRSGIDSGSTHNLEARHVDSFGGIGGSATTTVTMGTSAETPPDPSGVWIKFGEATT